jgi:uncharacterized protein
MTREEIACLIDTVEGASSNRHSFMHGPQHWRCVSLLGIELARETPGADPLVALLFGLFHDAMREGDHEDPEHGPRGAELFRKFWQTGLIPVTEEQAGAIIFACRTHTEADPTTDPVSGVCYDADRLNLWRCGTQPRGKYLSTEGGRRRALYCTTEHLHSTPLDWSDVLDLYFTPQASENR